AADHFMTALEVGSPTPTARVEIAHVTPVTINPAIVQRGTDTHHDLEAVAVLHTQAKGRAAAHGGARQHMRLGFRTNGVVFDKETPHVLNQVVLEGPCLAINEEATRAEQTGATVQTAVGRRDENGREFSAGYGSVNRFDDILKERVFILS